MSLLGKIFKSKLDQRQFEFREEYWRALEEKLDAQGRAAKFNYGSIIFSAVGALAILGAAIWFFNTGEENKVAENSTPAPAESVLYPDEEKAYGKEERNVKEPGISLRQNTVRAVVNPEERNSPEMNIASLVVKEKTGVLPGNGHVHQETSNRISGDVALKVKKDSKEGLAIVERPFGKNPSAGIEDNQFQEPLAEKTAVFSERAITETIASEAAVDKEQKDAREISAFGNKGDGTVASTEINLRMILMERNMPVLPRDPQSELKTITREEKMGKCRADYFAGIYSGIMYSDKILKSKIGNEYISRRENEESGSLTGNSGLYAGISFNRWNISAGINYHQQGEIIDYKPEFYQWMKNTTSTWNVTDNSYWESDTVNTFSYTVSEGSWQPVQTTVGYWSNGSFFPDDTIVMQQYVVDTTYTQFVYNVDSNFISQVDSAETVQIDSANQLVNDPSLKPGKTVSKITYVEFPVLVGYEIPISRLTLMVRTGFSVGLLSKINAAYLKNDISGVEMAGKERMSKAMINILLQTAVCFNITEKIAISAEPMFRMNMNNVFKDKEVTQKYWNTGLNAGVMYRF